VKFSWPRRADVIKVFITFSSQASDVGRAGKRELPELVFICCLVNLGRNCRWVRIIIDQPRLLPSQGEDHFLLLQKMDFCVHCKQISSVKKKQISIAADKIYIKFYAGV